MHKLPKGEMLLQTAAELMKKVLQAPFLSAPAAKSDKVFD